MDDGKSLLCRMYRAAAGNEPPLLRSFVSAAFAGLLRDCPGLAAGLFGDIGPFGAGTVAVHTDVPSLSDVRLDIVVEGEGDFRLLIENRLAPDLEWYEERTPQRPPSHADSYVSAARHRYGGKAKVLVLARSGADQTTRRYPPEVYAGVRSWPAIHRKMEEALHDAAEVPGYLIRQFLHLLKEHDMNPSEPLSPKDAETILAFDLFARNNLKLLEEAIGRIRQEFDLKSTPNNRRLTGWYACSDRFQSDEIHFFFYLMFPPVPDLIVRPALQVTKESSPRALAAAAEHGFRRGRWGSLWIERDFSTQHPFASLPANRQVEELVRFFQGPLSRLAKTGMVKAAPARHEETPRKGAGRQQGEKAAASVPGTEQKPTLAPGEPGPTAAHEEAQAPVVPLPDTAGPPELLAPEVESDAPRPVGPGTEVDPTPSS